MVTVKALSTFKMDGNEFEAGKVFPSEEERAFIMQRMGLVEVVPDTEEIMFGTGIMEGLEKKLELGPLEIAAGMERRAGDKE